MKDNNGKQAVAVLVVSCDRYADLWSPFFCQLSEYWSDCPFPVYLVSNEKAAADINAVSLRVGPDMSWSDNLRTALDDVKEEYVLLFIDDLFLIDHVNTPALLHVVEEFIDAGGESLKLAGARQLLGSVRHLFRRIPEGTAYRCSTVMTLWSRRVLSGMLLPGENAWEFEINGSARCDKHPEFYATAVDYFSIVNGVIKGRWSRVALRRVRESANANAEGERAVLSPYEEFLYQLSLMRSRALMHLPITRRRAVHQWLRKARASFLFRKSIK